jgi:hypothetical protein
VRFRRILGLLTLAGIAAILALLAINPVISTPATPRWEVWVVDEKGHPLQGMTVRLSWANYSVETTDHQEDLQTDENGYAVFPARAFTAPVKDRFLGTIRSAGGGVHASFGPHAFVFAFGRGLEGDSVTGRYITDWRGKPDRMQSRIIAKAGL